MLNFKCKQDLEIKMFWKQEEKRGLRKEWQVRTGKIRKRRAVKQFEG